MILANWGYNSEITTRGSFNFLEQHEYWMQKALLLAERAEQQGEIPVGAILVKNQRIIGQGWNQSISLSDPSAHAEMIAIREAGRVLNNYRLIGTTLYVTLEPCPMCAGLLVHSRIDRLVFGARDLKTGAGGSVMNILSDTRLNHQVEVIPDVLAEQCGNKLSMFFKRRRAEKKAAKKERVVSSQ